MQATAWLCVCVCLCKLLLPCPCPLPHACIKCHFFFFFANDETGLNAKIKAEATKMQTPRVHRVGPCAELRHGKGHRLLWTTINYLLLPCQRGLRTRPDASVCECVCATTGNEREGGRRAERGVQRGWWRCKRCYQVVCVRSLRCRPHKSFSIKCHALLCTLCESSHTHTHTDTHSSTHTHTHLHTHTRAEGMAHWVSPNTSHENVPRLSREEFAFSLLLLSMPRPIILFSALFMHAHTRTLSYLCSGLYWNASQKCEKFATSV